MSERDEFRLDVLDHLGGDGLAADLGLVGLRRAAAGEIHRHDVAGGLGRGQRLEGALDPLGGRLVEIEVAIDPIEHPLGPELGQPGVEALPDGAELGIRGVAEGQDAELHAVEARGALAHQLAIGPHRPSRRLALAPGRRDDDEALLAAEGGDVEIGEVDRLRLEAVLARELGDVPGEFFPKFPDSLANTIVSGSAARGGAAGAGASAAGAPAAASSRRGSR